VPAKSRVIGPDAATAENARLARVLKDGGYREIEVFKNDRQTYSALIRLDGQFYVLKIPRERNNRLWQRLLSLFRSSEAVRHYHSMVRLRDLGFNGPEPVLALEQRRLGAVVDSCLLYRFRKGRKATREDAALVLPYLLALHEAGYLRNDPHAKNYLIDDGNVVFIDFRLKRPIFLRRFRLHRELAQFLKTSPSAWDLLPGNVSRSWSMRLAVGLDKVFRIVRHSRRRLRSWFRVESEA